MFLGKRKHLKIQPSRAELPLASMTVGTFKVDAARFFIWWNIPTPASLICNERETIMGGHLVHEGFIRLYRFKSVGNG
jgi:hypothetical protein